MGISGHKKLRSFLQSCLVRRGDRAKFQDDESLFVSGRLDLLAITSVINYLEQKYYIDFSDASFDVELIDSVQAIESFVDGKAGGPFHLNHGLVYRLAQKTSNPGIHFSSNRQTDF